MNIKKIEEQVKLQGKLRDFEWVIRQYEKGRLYLDGNQLEENSFEQFRVFIRLVNEIYENLWDIDFDALHHQDKVIFNIKGPVLHFKEVNIYNRDRKTHLIKDLFVRIALRLDGRTFKIAQIQGGRATFSYAEVSSNYAHSHLPGNGFDRRTQIPYYQKFCTGSGHINDYMAEINSGDFTEENVTRLLVQIMGLVNYESIEGNPHRYISNITIRTQSGRRFNTNNTQSLQLYSKLLNHHRAAGTKPDLEFKIEDGRYKIKDDISLERFLLSQPMSIPEKKAYLAFIDETGTAYQYGENPRYATLELPSATYNKFIFRGELIQLQVEAMPNQQDDSNIEYKLHPTVKQVIKEEIEYDINKKTIRKSTIDRYSNQTSDARDSITSDPTPVSADI